MDEIVKQAMTKWPDVPNCYGWLALDARGTWRMRDEHTQAMHLPGDKITNTALVGFINRNYQSDERGCWYFQNGPQRVYVMLAKTPYIAHTDPLYGFVLHTGEPLSMIDDVWITENGDLLLKSDGKVAMLDDRDIAQCLPHLRLDRKPIGDEQLLSWIAVQKNGAQLTLELPSRSVPVQRIQSNDIPKQFHFVLEPPIPA
jgi:hypothetical protein